MTFCSLPGSFRSTAKNIFRLSATPDPPGDRSYSEGHCFSMVTEAAAKVTHFVPKTGESARRLTAHLIRKRFIFLIRSPVSSEAQRRKNRYPSHMLRIPTRQGVCFLNGSHMLAEANCIGYSLRSENGESVREIYCFIFHPFRSNATAFI